MALLSKSVIEEPKYHGRGHKNTIIYNDLIITVIFSPGVSNSHLCNSQYDQLELKFKIRSLN